MKMPVKARVRTVLLTFNEQSLMVGLRPGKQELVGIGPDQPNIVTLNCHHEYRQFLRGSRSKWSQNPFFLIRRGAARSF